MGRTALATRILGDFGAEVIKISDPRVPIDRLGGTNNKLNRNKPNMALRLDHDGGRDTFVELVKTADVVVENFRPRVMNNFNLTYTTCAPSVPTSSCALCPDMERRASTPTTPPSVPR